MPARGIFLKIYLCFWLSSLLVIAAQIGFDWVSRSGPFGRGPADEAYMKRVLGPILVLYGHSIIEENKDAHHDAMERSAQKLKDLSGIDAYVLGPAGAPLGGRELPPDVEDMAKKAKKTGKMEFHSSRGRILLASPVGGEEGRGYIVVGDIPRRVLAPPPPPHGHGPPPPMILAPGFFVPPGEPFLLLRTFITLLISGGICYLLARYLTAPIVRLREAARRFADGELSARFGRKRVIWKDELSDLAGDFDTMAERIESLVTQQRRLIRDISHELRSPLARLTIAVELLRHQGGTAASSTLGRIEKEVMVLNDMIGQVLELTRAESNTSSMETVPVDLTLLIDEIVDDANFEAGVRGCAVHFTDPGACTVCGNEEWLRRGIENVVRNAIRYTSDGTTVEIRLTRNGEEGLEYARISVRDHGEGVPESDLPHLFRPFYRVSAARDRQTGGTGLGLAITWSAVSLHHGSVTAENAPGGGLVVTIDLPLNARPQVV